LLVRVPLRRGIGWVRSSAMWACSGAAGGGGIVSWRCRPCPFGRAGGRWAVKASSWCRLRFSSSRSAMRRPLRTEELRMHSEAPTVPPSRAAPMYVAGVNGVNGHLRSFRRGPIPAR
jgi:hypothetical protein